MPALSLCILWCMFLSGESRKEAICEIAIKPRQFNSMML